MLAYSTATYFCISSLLSCFQKKQNQQRDLKFKSNLLLF